MNILKKMLDEYDYVQRNAKHVSIDYDMLEKYCATIRVKKNTNWLEKTNFGLEKLSKEQMINFLLLYNSMNFSYFGDPKWSIEYNGEIYDGALGLIAAFARSFESSFNMIDFNYIKDLSYDDFKNFINGNIEIPMIEKRYENIITTSKVVCKKMKGNFAKYIRNVKNDTKLFEIVINNFKSFEDVSTYNGKTIHFYKRAQLLVSDILHYISKYNNNVVYSNIIGAADYKIPQVLRYKKIIKYDESLERLVDNCIAIKKNSTYEVEIRAVTLYVINYISKRLIKYPSFEINDAIWLESQSMPSNVKPYHRTRTTAY